MKRCSRCKVKKPLDTFNSDKSKSDGRFRWCRACSSENIKRAAEYRARNRKAICAKSLARYRANKSSIADSVAARRVGISAIEYRRLVADSGGICAICDRRPSAGRSRRLHLDHCHATGVVRGMLCHLCNVGLGHFGENIEVMERAVEYLRAHGEKNARVI